MNIHVPIASHVPKWLRITQTMVEDFLIDPVLGAKVIFGVELDAFQRIRLRTYWWVPNVMDSSGVGTGKTMCNFLWANLRCMLLGNQVGLVLYQNFESGQDQFWKYYRELRSPIFQAQLGKVDKEGESEGKANRKGPSCWFQHFKADDSLLMMPAPDWLRGAQGRAGMDVNFALLDEWTKSENAKKEGRSGIDEQIIARVRRGSFNQHHPLWGNHWLYTASAQSPEHPGYERVKMFERRIKAGDPRYAHIQFSYKDYSNMPSHVPGKTMAQQHRNEAMYNNLRLLGTAEFKRQGLGLWERETRGWYTEASVQKCRELGARMGLEPETERIVIE